MTTYSDSLKLTLIGDGEQTGVWGDTTNTNLGELIEQAICYQTSITMIGGSDYTLTSLNGAPDEARSATLIINGTQTGTNNVIVPAKQKIYIITNNLNSNAIAYVKPVGGTSLVIGNGKTIIAYCDESELIPVNFVDAAGTAVVANTTTNIAGGAAGSIPVQTSSGVTSLLPAGTDGFVLTLASGIPEWRTAGTATTASNLAGGSGGGQVVYQAGTNSTAFVPAGSPGQVLVSNGTSPPSWSAGVPTGIITMWSGSIATIPLGWLLCNGTNGTPDLRDRFIVGAGSTYSVSATGGSANATLVSHDHSFSGGGSTNTGSALGTHNHGFSGTTANAGTHTHTINDPGHFHSVNVDSDTAAAGGSNFKSDNQLTGTNNTNSSQTFISINSAGDHNHTFSGTTDPNPNLAHTHSVSLSVSGSTSSSGSSATNANLPPYYALAYIMKG
jgi:hypothetical protein